MKKYSKQRELIIENLRKRKDHPTAEKLYTDLKKEIPEIGIATIYRNLTELCSKGVIVKVKTKSGPDRYDGNNVPHNHFECKICGKIEDIFLNDSQKQQIKEITESITKNAGIKLEGTELNMEGICQKCMAKLNNS